MVNTEKFDNIRTINSKFLSKEWSFDIGWVDVWNIITEVTPIKVQLQVVFVKDNNYLFSQFFDNEIDENQEISVVNNKWVLKEGINSIQSLKAEGYKSSIRYSLFLIFDEKVMKLQVSSSSKNNIKTLISEKKWECVNLTTSSYQSKYWLIYTLNYEPSDSEVDIDFKPYVETIKNYIATENSKFRENKVCETENSKKIDELFND